MTHALATVEPIDAALVERVLIHGDLRALTPAQKVVYYNQVCDSIGLNPLTQPFQYLVLNGKEILYARRDATEQLRKLHAVSIVIAAREVTEGIYVVTARASLLNGRTDESIGAVAIETLKGENRANAMMKAETKAKRRVTLAICGLGMLDETEVESIPDLVVQAPVRGSAVPAAGHGLLPSAPNGGDSAISSTPTGTLIGNPADRGSRENPGQGGTGENPAQLLPDGYFYISDYSYRNGWHNVVINGWDSQGGAMTFSTKRPLGAVAEEAFNKQIPVRIDWAPKPNSRGEAWLNGVELLYDEDDAPDDGPTNHGVPISDDDIPFLWLLPMLLPFVGVLLS